MARLYANENFPVEVVERLRLLGHDVLTTHDVGKSNQGLEDNAVLRFAIETNRCVVTINRKDFMRLHRTASGHSGIIVCTETMPILRRGLMTSFAKPETYLVSSFVLCAASLLAPGDQ